ncbi:MULTISPECIES: hypothetical protein [unclassified Shinella]|jgi:hypothetical protein|uniref:hypothetical protein n=1 Tax=unclassified Shinella TaxID=2643062 RepID=UPI0012DD034F|nr:MULTISPECIES: hypothetical protein [unclassified Shinella]MCA0344994.1 hypothetical protein [Pseudomonadota bacterium]MCO5154286.1 hypothetical protein [Shinella sp.]MDC7261648.1 hypothetical protein [Shinella sp. HY16]MDC7268543.1 hypothetical protein [Shinella sp. YZ44]MDG4671655.1 hypothetical protein [Shinella sp. 838]
MRRPGGIVREEAAEILALHNGNALEALRTLIAERDAVEERLAVATLIMRRQWEADDQR